MQQTSNNESLEILSTQFIQSEKLAIIWKFIAIWMNQIFEFKNYMKFGSNNCNLLLEIKR